MSEIRVDNITDEAGTGRPDFSNGIKTSNINGGPIGRRNAIINGNFGINQRGVSGTVSLSAGEYGHDRWKAGASGATYTFSTSGGVTTVDISAGSLIQVVEDVNVVTDTYVLSWTGTAQGKIGSGSFDDSGVTESVTGGSNLNIEFDTGTVSKVQLEVGDTATEFEHRSIGEELALCQRYYQRNNSILNITRTNSGNWAYYYFYKVNMRTAPTVSFPNGTYYNVITGTSHRDNYMYFNAQSVSVSTSTGHTVARINSPIIFDAEL